MLPAAFTARLGDRLHVLIHNAGINLRKAITDFTLAEWNSVMTTNVASVFLLCRAFLPMQRRPKFWVKMIAGSVGAVAGVT